jgi:hypothetical protein
VAELGTACTHFQVDTGGKSIHSYWYCEDIASADAWRQLQVDLLEFADADRSCKNPSRVMRLAGCLHPSGHRSRILNATGTQYRYDSLRSLVPRSQATVQADRGVVRWHDFNKGFRVPVAESVPLELCLTRENRDLIQNGNLEGARNDKGYALAANLIATADYLSSIGQRYEGQPEQLFEDYCRPVRSNRLE